MLERDWSDARAKVEREGRCRLATGCRGPIESAHTVAREHDVYRNGVLWVNPDDVVPLCRAHHTHYDARRLDLLPYLTLVEQGAMAAKLGLVRALARATGAGHK